MTGESDSLCGELRRNEPLAAYTSWRVGGPADRLYIPADAADLAQFLAQLPEDEQVIFLGLGSNLLVRDGGVRGTVIVLKNVLDELEQEPDGVIRAGAGVPCAKVARFSVRAGLTGAEFLAGIPGTLGGALAMNAGAFGGETWDIVAGVETMDRRGRRRLRPREEFRIGYRTVVAPGDEWFLAARLALRRAADERGNERIRELLARRSATQPMGEFSCGSVFRNPEGDHAARLIETCALKGQRVGGARVSEKHANFIINDGTASAADIEQLMQRVEETVAKQFGIRLQREVRIIGVTGMNHADGD